MIVICPNCHQKMDVPPGFNPADLPNCPGCNAPVDLAKLMAEAQSTPVVAQAVPVVAQPVVAQAVPVPAPAAAEEVVPEADVSGDTVNMNYSRKPGRRNPGQRKVIDSAAPSESKVVERSRKSQFPVGVAVTIGLCLVIGVVAFLCWPDSKPKGPTAGSAEYEADRLRAEALSKRLKEDREREAAERAKAEEINGAIAEAHKVDTALLNADRIAEYGRKLAEIQVPITGKLDDPAPFQWPCHYNLVLTGAQAFPLLSSKDYQVLMACTEYGKGRVVVVAGDTPNMTHPEYPDIVLGNVLNYLIRGKAAGEIGVYGNVPARRLMARKFKKVHSVKDMSTALTNTAGFDAVVVCAEQAPSEREIEHLFKTVYESGQNVLITASNLKNLSDERIMELGILPLPVTREIEAAHNKALDKNLNTLLALSRVSDKDMLAKITPEERPILSAILIRALQDIPTDNQSIIPSFEKFAARLPAKFTVDVDMSRARKGIRPPQVMKRKPFTLSEKIKIAYLDAQIRAKPLEKQGMHPAAEVYPGRWSDFQRAKREDVELKINTVVPYLASTGYYAFPGEIVTVEINPQDVNRGLQAVIGINSEIIPPEEEWYRAPDIVRRFDLKTTETKICNPYGGPIYIAVPDRKKRTLPPPSAMTDPTVIGDDTWLIADETVTDPTQKMKMTRVSKNVPVKLYNVMVMCHYQVGMNRPMDWENLIAKYENNEMPPLLEIECNNVILTLNTHDALSYVDRPEKTASLWEDIMDECKIFTGRDFTVPFPVRIATDSIEKPRQAPYPVVVPITHTKRLVDYFEAKRKGSNEVVAAMIYFFMGKSADLPGKMDVMRWLFTSYLVEMSTTANRRDVHPELSKEREQQRLPEILNSTYRWNGTDTFGKLYPYLQLVDEFGWMTMTDTIAEYGTLSDEQWPKTDEELHWDFAKRFSYRANSNVVVFLKVWGWRMPKESNMENWVPLLDRPAKPKPKRGEPPPEPDMQERLLSMPVWLPEYFPDSFFEIR